VTIFGSVGLAFQGLAAGWLAYNVPKRNWRHSGDVQSRRALEFNESDGTTSATLERVIFKSHFPVYRLPRT
jgi:hypothetical protein